MFVIEYIKGCQKLIKTWLEEDEEYRHQRLIRVTLSVLYTSAALSICFMLLFMVLVLYCVKKYPSWVSIEGYIFILNYKHNFEAIKKLKLLF